MVGGGECVHVEEPGIFAPRGDEEEGMSGNPERLRRAFRPPPAHYDVHETAAFAVARACRALRGALAADRGKLGLFEGRDLVLLEIARLDGAATPKRVEKALGMTPSSLSTVLRRSVAAGYVTRERDPDDGRSWRLGLTPTGRACARLAAKMWRDADGVLGSRLAWSDVVWLRHLSREATLAWRTGASPADPTMPGDLARATPVGEGPLGFGARGRTEPP
jgi:MarR family transcriptional regulator, organic hydroperoxide resistance regulator